jgi:hypothetical protein
MYTGKPHDTVMGMYNYRYRDYKPETAQFACTNNDPVNRVDLWGLKPGDIFSSMDDVANGFDLTYKSLAFPQTVRRNLEKQ